jgi:prolipoprotein diacylglyceryltransferase
VHPVAAYDGLIMVVVFVVLVLYWRRIRGRPPESRVYWLYLLLFGAFRFLTSFLRLDPLFIDGLQEAQLLGLIYTVAAVIMLPILIARGRLDSADGRATTTLA